MGDALWEIYIFVNILLFTDDDIYAFGPRISGFQRLNIFCDYAPEHKIIFNCNVGSRFIFSPYKV